MASWSHKITETGSSSRVMCPMTTALLMPSQKELFSFKTQLPSMHIKPSFSMHLETLAFPSSYSKPLVIEPFNEMHARQPGNVNIGWVSAQC